MEDNLGPVARRLLSSSEKNLEEEHLLHVVESCPPGAEDGGSLSWNPENLPGQVEGVTRGSAFPLACGYGPALRNPHSPS